MKIGRRLGADRTVGHARPASMKGPIMKIGRSAACRAARHRHQASMKGPIMKIGRPSHCCCRTGSRSTCLNEGADHEDRPAAATGERPTVDVRRASMKGPIMKIGRRCVECSGQATLYSSLNEGADHEDRPAVQLGAPFRRQTHASMKGPIMKIGRLLVSVRAGGGGGHASMKGPIMKIGRRERFRAAPRLSGPGLNEGADHEDRPAVALLLPDWVRISVPQ